MAKPAELPGSQWEGPGPVGHPGKGTEETGVSPVSRELRRQA